MGSPPRSPREEEQRLNIRTLVIASAASATAALVTSRLWIAGTWIAAAMTPVLVTLISEMLRRPTERIARGITVDRPALPDPEAAAAARPRQPDDHPVPDPEAPLPGQLGPTRVYRSESARTPPRRRRIAYNIVFGTAALAFVIGVLVLTVPELIAGSSVGKNDGRTTLFGGPKKKSSNGSNTQTPQRTTTEQTETEQTTSTEEPDTDTETTPTETTPAQPQSEPPPTDTAPSTTTTP